MPVLKAHSQAGNIQEASELLDNMIGCGIVPDDSLYDIVINGLCKQGSLEKVNNIFKLMLEKGLVPNKNS